MQNLLTKYGQYFYLFLAIIGGGFTFYYAIKGSVIHHGNFSITEFISSTWIDNMYAKSITLDFWTGAIAGTFFMMVEGLRLKIKRLWLYILFTFLIAFAFAFPLFLFVRHNAINKKNRY
jgi:Terpene cyclase DEP1